MKNTIKVLGIIAFIAVFTFSAATCSAQSGGGGKALNSPEALKEYLDSQPANSPDKPIKVSMGANELMLPKIRDVLNSAGKYVSLNLTGNALKTIPERAFSDSRIDNSLNKECEALVSITIPNGVTSIGEAAFFGCTNLTSVNIPNSVTSIGMMSFLRCENLTSIIIPASVISIEDDAFALCTSLKNVIFQGTISSNNFNGAFHGDLEEKYLAGGIGTYTTSTPVPENKYYWKPVWTKK